MADTHLPRGSRLLPAACVEQLRAADLILHAGDFVSLAFLTELKSLGPRVVGVHGNLDEPAVQVRLPAEQIVEAGGVRIAMLHDAGPRAGREARLAARYPDCEAVVYGHTHVAQAERVGTHWILNPGSPTERRSAPRHTMLMLQLAGGAIEPHLIALS